MARAARVLLALGLVGLVVDVLLMVVPFVLRAWGSDPRTTFAGVENFRVVDERVWAGAQPSRQAQQALAHRGVQLVVNLRTGAADDRSLDDLDLLERLGVEHLRMPVPDGHVPSSAEVDRFVEAVRATEGIVLVHCGGGVGRSSALTAAYERAIGRAVDVDEHLAIGPHTLAQLWFVTGGDRNVAVQRLSEALDLPRRTLSRLRAWVI